MGVWGCRLWLKLVQSKGALNTPWVPRAHPVLEDVRQDLYKEVTAAAHSAGGHSSRSKSTSTVKELPGPQASGKTDFAEYASVDRNRKCRQSANAESILGNSWDPEEEAPPPVPIKLLDENENLQEQAESKTGEEGAAEGTSEANKVGSGTLVSELLSQLGV